MSDEEDIAELFTEIQGEYLKDADRHAIESEGKGRVRNVHVVDEDGNTVRQATHGQVLRGLLDHHGIEDASVIDKRPTVGECEECGVAFTIKPTGFVARFCGKKCGRRAYRRTNSSEISARVAEIRRSRLASDPEYREAQAEYARKNRKRAYAGKRRRRAAQKKTLENG